jgi:hypothetical protein
MQRTTVDVPDPEGPISAVALLGSKARLSLLMVCRSPYQASSPAISTVRACTSEASALGASPSRVVVMRLGEAGISGGSMSDPGSVTG